MGSINTSPFWPMQDGINEVIATTMVNAAPMGIICRDNRLMMAVFRTSHTALHIENQGVIVANIIHDPVLFVQTAFSDLPSDAFIYENVGDQEVCRLADAQSYVIYRADIVQKTEQKILVSLTPEKTQLAHTPLIPINRGFSSVIEATVHGTRYIINKDPKLLILIDHHADLVMRCGGEKERTALRLLRTFIT
jgi:hypothetical protein